MTPTGRLALSLGGLFAAGFALAALFLLYRQPGMLSAWLAGLSFCG